MTTYFVDTFGTFSQALYHDDENDLRISISYDQKQVQNSVVTLTMTTDDLEYIINR